MASDERMFTKKPCTPSSMISGPPEFKVVITGKPCDKASGMIKPKPSESAGWTKTSCAAISASTVECGAVGIQRYLRSVFIQTGGSADAPAKHGEFDLIAEFVYGIDQVADTFALGECAHEQDAELAVFRGWVGGWAQSTHLLRREQCGAFLMKLQPPLRCGPRAHWGPRCGRRGPVPRLCFRCGPAGLLVLQLYRRIRGGVRLLRAADRPHSTSGRWVAHRCT